MITVKDDIRSDHPFPCWRDARDDVRVCFVGRSENGATLELPELVRRLTGPGPRPAWLRQVHSATVLPAREREVGEGDALWTRRHDLALTVQTADCVPVLLAGGDELAAVHAGWRGIAAGIVPAAVERLASMPAALTAWIGPAIGVCCYEVGEDVAEKVLAALPEGAATSVVRRGAAPRPHLDLRAAVAGQLATAGVDDVRRLGGCTRCDAEHLWSYRRDGLSAGRNLAVVWRTGYNHRRR